MLFITTKRGHQVKEGTNRLYAQEPQLLPNTTLDNFKMLGSYFKNISFVTIITIISIFMSSAMQ